MVATAVFFGGMLMEHRRELHTDHIVSVLRFSLELIRRILFMHGISVAIGRDGETVRASVADRAANPDGCVYVHPAPDDASISYGLDQSHRGRAPIEATDQGPGRRLPSDKQRPVTEYSTMEKRGGRLLRICLPGGRRPPPPPPYEASSWGLSEQASEAAYLGDVAVEAGWHSRMAESNLYEYE